MKYSIFAIYLLFGMGRNLPEEAMYYKGVGLVDTAFIFIIAMILSSAARVKLLLEIQRVRYLALAILIIVFFATSSLFFNMFIYGVEIKDLFEIARYVYSFFVLTFTIFAVKRYGAYIMIGFPIGIIITGVVAIMNPMNPDVLGTPQIFNPNVIGNALAVSVFFSSILILSRHIVKGTVLGIISAGIAFYTFSKGTWIMTALGLLACLMALQMRAGINDRRLSGNISKILASSLFGVMIYVLYDNYEIISTIVEAKIMATKFESTAVEGGSFAARVGLILSAARMALLNPLLGVGISNFEVVNRSLQTELGNYFYDDDNPNSAFFYVLGCMGVIPFIAFCFIYWTFVKKLSGLVSSDKIKGLVFTLCGALIILIGGNVQVEMLTGYYFWVLLGFVMAGNLAGPEARKQR